MQQRFVKAGLILVGNHQNIILVAVERLTEHFVCSDVPPLFVKVHSCLSKRLIAGVIFQRNLTREGNHGITTGAFVRVRLDITLDSEIVAYGVGTAVCNDHGFTLAINLIAAVLQKVCHDHLGFLGDGVAVLLVILEQRTGSLPFDQLRVVLRHTN